MRYTVENGNSKSSGAVEPCESGLTATPPPVSSNSQSPSPLPEASPEGTEVRVEIEHTSEEATEGGRGEENVQDRSDREEARVDHSSGGQLPEKVEESAEGEEEAKENSRSEGVKEVEVEEQGEEEEEVKRKPEGNTAGEVEVDSAAADNSESEDGKIYNLFAISVSCINPSSLQYSLFPDLTRSHKAVTSPLG